jgi:hypothetical protein
MNRFAAAAVAATLLAIAGTAGAWKEWGNAAFGDRSQGSAGRQGALAQAREGDPEKASPQGFAEPRMAGQPYYGWHYPFALPFSSAIQGADTPETRRPR